MRSLIVILCVSVQFAAAGQSVLRSGSVQSWATLAPPAASCATNISILPSSTDYWSAAIHSQKIALTGTTNVCRLYVKGDTHNATDRAIYAQIRTAKNGGGSQWGGNSTTNTLTAGAANVVELTFSAPLPAPTGDYFVNLVSADCYNIYITYSAADEYGGASYVASSDATDRAQDLWLISCYQ